MCKISQSHVVSFVLVLISWCGQAICAGGGWRVLDRQDIADINALLPSLVIPGKGLWTKVRNNLPVGGPLETVQAHYNKRHGMCGEHTRTRPFFNGVAVAAIGGTNPATAEEVVMANFIATIVPDLLVGTQVRKKSGGTKEIQIPVPAALEIQVTKRGSRGTAEPARFCSIILPEALPVPAGTLAPPPTNICTLFFTG